MHGWPVPATGSSRLGDEVDIASSKRRHGRRRRNAVPELFGPSGRRFEQELSEKGGEW